MIVPAGTSGGRSTLSATGWAETSVLGAGVVTTGGVVADVVVEVDRLGFVPLLFRVLPRRSPDVDVDVVVGCCGELDGAGLVEGEAAAGLGVADPALSDPDGLDFDGSSVDPSNAWSPPPGPE